MAIETLLKPKEETFKDYLLRNHWLTNFIFLRKVDTISHLSRSTLSIFIKTLELVFSLLGAMAILAHRVYQDEPSIYILLQNPEGVLAVGLVIGIPIITLFVELVFEFILTQAENVRRPSLIRMTAFSMFLLALLISVVCCGAILIFGRSVVMHVALVIFFGQMIWSTLLAQPVRLLLLYYFRSNYGSLRGDDPIVRFFPPSLKTKNLEDPYLSIDEKMKEEKEREREMKKVDRLLS
eukprot:TRINITY_DN3459_c0_g1_i1.p1 TRINITY_DN3459_c0_g1~~TRINITY_DN3459_c0_g1_i1.p1  ORF type:complete len:237 (-),score=29.62 TRINITY_DN3459_c0_g1_i1:145-855(-)